MKTGFLLLVLIVFNLTLQGQKEKIEEIEKRYSLLEKTDKEDFNTYVIDMNYVLPSGESGTEVKVIAFYFLPSPSDSENKPYKADVSLQKVTVSFNVGVTGGFNYEYLYSDEGKLIFFSENFGSSSVSYEKQFYFNNNKLIKYDFINPDPVTDEDLHNPKLKKFSKKILSEAQNGIKRSKEYQLYFIQLGKMDDID